ncbi:MAG: ABC transporter ATP-binding protein [Chloroflexi bacterium]|nr:ABC transporter ATP-binding protein [Chloroflexota bacterium]
MKLEIRGVSKTFQSKRGSLTAFDPIDLDIREGEFVCLLGPSGCGKSTLLNIIAGLDKPTRGEVRVDGRVVTRAGTERVMIFQNAALFPWLNVFDNVKFGLNMIGVAKPERQIVARRYLQMVHLAEFERAFVHELSGGMKQRVAIARALALNPDILLMDEPFGALDAQTRDVLHDELQAIWSNTRKTIVFVTHNVREAVVLGDRVIVLSARPARIKQEFVIDLPRLRQIESYAVVDRARAISALLKEDTHASQRDVAANVLHELEAQMVGDDVL